MTEENQSRSSKRTGGIWPDWPRMMLRATAAAYLDMSVPAFEREVGAGRLPMPVKLGSREHWDRTIIDTALDVLQGRIEDDYSWRADLPMYIRAAAKEGMDVHSYLAKHFPGR